MGGEGTVNAGRPGHIIPFTPQLQRVPSARNVARHGPPSVARIPASTQAGSFGAVPSLPSTNAESEQSLSPCSPRTELFVVCMIQKVFQFVSTALWEGKQWDFLGKNGGSGGARTRNLC